MARRKSERTAPSDDGHGKEPRKRSRQGLADEDFDVAAEDTPSKRRRTASRRALEASANGVTDKRSVQNADPGDGEPVATPRKRGRPPKAQSLQTHGTTTPSKARHSSKPVTPVKQAGSNGITPRRRQAADRSAKRKSARALIERVVGDGLSDEEEDLVQEIYESSEEGDEDLEREDSEGGEAEPASVATTQPETPKRRPGRPRKTRSPTPPRDLPPHELYFHDNKPGRAKTSSNTLAGLELLTHEEYFSVIRQHKDRHTEDIEFLESLHTESFPQWRFELAQGFSVCLFGFGSKRQLLLKFAKHAYSETQDHGANKTVIINGYVHTITIREIMATISSAIDPSQRLPASQPTTMLQTLSSELAKSRKKLTVVVNSIDAPPLRKAGVQTILGHLASLPQIQLICSADTPDFSLLWDSGLRSAFNFVFHDCTTFAPSSVEIDVIDEVHELLGRKARRAGGKDGVIFVLRSLTQNAKDLFRLLVMEILVAMEEETGSAGENPGVEYRMMYNKAVEEFVCSSEVSFRGLLKEFHDHQMITSRKDAIGTELLSVPLPKVELESILEDLMS